MRKGSMVLWLLIIALVAFVLFNVVVKTGALKVKSFQLIHNTPVSSVTVPGNTPESAPIPPLEIAARELSKTAYKKVRIGSVNAPYSGQGGQLSLLADYSLKEPIDVTGWVVTGNKGGQVIIPQAIANFNPASASMTPKSDIMLTAGGSVTVYGWQNPLNVNFRLNKCMGYLNQQYTIVPSLPYDCPRVDSVHLSLLSGQCQNFIRSLSACTTPKPDELNRVGGFLEPECRALVDKQNQTGCYNDHATDADFLSREWRAWVGFQFPFDPLHDRLILRDRAGNVVDDYTY